MDPDGVVRGVLEELEGYADEARRKKAGTYYPTSFKVLGVPVPDQRKVTNALISKMKGAAPDEKLSMALALVRTGVFECQQVAYEMLSRDGRALGLLTLGELLELRKGFDNWISVDTWSTYLAGVAWREGRIPDDVVIGWTASADPWVRRSALVCTIPLNQISRGGRGDPDRTLMICGKLMRDRDR
ncbi:MAG TPA: DNA alkylation repair protein, partial [Euryarchaeota archaeon]|nr:DNA alkylation repair protein [Euryarchaeota archaeon]